MESEIRSPEPGPPERMWRLPTWLMNQAASRCYRLVSDGLRSRGWQTNHFAILCALEEFESSSQATLSRALGIDGSDVVAALNELQGRGLIVRTQDSSDRRRNAVSVNAAGKQELGHLIKLVDAAQEKALSTLSDSERQDLRLLLTRVVEDQTRWSRPTASGLR